MAVTNFLVTSLPAYVQESRDPIIKNFALVGSDTRRRIGLRTGIKSGEHLPFLDFNLVLQSGSGCGFNPLDEATLTQKTVTVVALEHDGQLCPETLLGKYAEYLVRINATENDLPYEAYLMDVMGREVNKVIEKLIWQGNTTSGQGNMAMLNGFLAQFAADTDVLTSTAGNDIYESIQNVYMAMPDETLDRGGMIFISPANYRSFLQEMVAKNYYHYAGPSDAAPETFVFPGSDVVVVKTPGLAGSNAIVGTFADNLTYLTDVDGDEVDVDLWWSQDVRLFKWQVKWTSGVAYYFPAQVVLGTAV